MGCVSHHCGLEKCAQGVRNSVLLALVKSKIYTIRGQKVMLDFDLAQMYEVETKTLNQAVKRNIKRFDGDDFMFRLTKDTNDCNTVTLLHLGIKNIASNVNKIG